MFHWLNRLFCLIGAWWVCDMIDGGSRPLVWICVQDVYNSISILSYVSLSFDVIWERCLLCRRSDNIGIGKSRMYAMWCMYMKVCKDGKHRSVLMKMQYSANQLKMVPCPSRSVHTISQKCPYKAGTTVTPSKIPIKVFSSTGGRFVEFSKGSWVLLYHTSKHSTWISTTPVYAQCSPSFTCAHMSSVVFLAIHFHNHHPTVEATERSTVIVWGLQV